MSDGRVEFEIVGDTSGIDQSIKEVTETIKEESQKWGEAASGGIQDITAEMQASVAQISESTSSSASDMRESVTNAVSGASESARSAIGNVGTASNETAAITQKVLEGLAVGLTAAIVSATGQLISAFAEWAAASVEAAANLEQIENIVDMTFGQEAAAKIKEWAGTATLQFGYTQVQAEKFAASMGTVMKMSGLSSTEIADMSTDLAGLAADMGAFLGIDADKAFNKLKSAMQGSKTALKDLGVEMEGDAFNDFYDTLGFEDAFKDLSQADQFVVRYKFIMEQLSDIQYTYARDFADTSKGLEAQTKAVLDTAQENLGQKILPVKKWAQEQWLGILKFVTGIDETPFTGTENQLVKWSTKDLPAAIETANAELDKLAEKYAEVAGVTREDFLQSSFYEQGGTFADYVYANLQKVWDDQYNERLDAFDEQYRIIEEAEKKIADYQSQLSKMGYSPDTEANSMESAQGVVDGLQAMEPAIQAEVNAINDILGQMGDGGSFTGFIGLPVGGYATGLSWVPRNNFPAFLHEGEGVLTAEENKVWQRFKNGWPTTGIDYDALGGVMRGNIKAGGDVFLDSRIVGQVISGIQGNAYRSLQRSGWQG